MCFFRFIKEYDPSNSEDLPHIPVIPGLKYDLPLPGLKEFYCAASEFTLDDEDGPFDSRVALDVWAKENGLRVPNRSPD